MGQDGFNWYVGVVEDRDDPLEIGRCRVRILGFHSQDKGDIPVDGLPWAYPAMPINSRPGDPPIGPVIGTWVMGFFRDGNDAQEPVMTHIIDSGYKTEDDPAPPESAPSWGGKRDISTGWFINLFELKMFSFSSKMYYFKRLTC